MTPSLAGGPPGAVDPMAGYRTLARFLGVGAAAGAGIGGLLAGAYFPIGVLVGSVAGVLTQAFGLLLLLAARRLHPALSPRGRCALVITVAVLAALAMSALFSGAWGDGVPRAVPVLVGGGLALALGVLAAPWCLRELPWPRRR